MSGEGLVVYRFYRYHVPGEDEYDTLEEALGRAYWDIEWNTAAPHEIVVGDEVLDRTFIDRYLEKRWAEESEKWARG